MNYFAYDETGRQLEFSAAEENGRIFLTLDKSLFQNSAKLTLLPELSEAKAGDEGYYLMPRNISMRGDFQVFFTEREDTEFDYDHPILSLYGIKKPGFCALLRVERNYKYHYVIRCKGGIYTATPVLLFNTDTSDLPYDDVRIEIVRLPDSAGYAEMAAAERNTRLSRGEIAPLSEKCAERPVMEYQRRAPMIRIRMGWKQSPSPVKHQRPDNEPDVHVACTFADVRRIADKLKEHGVERADLQMVGWNIGGHDGRFPQFFPVDERLGGEEEMRKTVEYVKSLGFHVSTHTIWIDSYEIADCFSWRNVVQKKKGGYLQVGDYGGGLSYHVCPKMQYENASRVEPRLAALGENGIHFTDVISIVEPDTCHSPDHPCTTAEGISEAKNLIRYIKGQYGAFCSEGAMDFALSDIDYALYVTFGDGFGAKSYPLNDRYLPFWELVYHGIVYYNPASPTINFTVKDPADRLTFIMRGGLPSFYFYSKFRTGAKNWMGDNDLTLEALDESAAKIREGMDIYRPFEDRQLIYMKDYVFAGDGIEIAEYEDGFRVIGNFSDTERVFEGSTIAPFGYIMKGQSSRM